MWMTYSPAGRGVKEAAFGAAFVAVILEEDIFDAGFFVADPGA